MRVIGIQRFRESLQEASAGPEPVGIVLECGVDKDQYRTATCLSETGSFHNEALPNDLELQRTTTSVAPRPPARRSIQLLGGEAVQSFPSAASRTGRAVVSGARRSRCRCPTTGRGARGRRSSADHPSVAVTEATRTFPRKFICPVGHPWAA